MKATIVFFVVATTVSVVQALPIPAGTNALMKRSLSGFPVPEIAHEITHVNSSSISEAQDAHDVRHAFLESRGLGIPKVPLELSESTRGDMQTPLLQASGSSSALGPIENSGSNFFSRFSKALGSPFKHEPADVSSSDSRNIWSIDNSPLQLTNQGTRAEAQVKAAREEKEALEAFDDARANVERMAEREKEALSNVANVRRDRDQATEPAARLYHEAALEMAEFKHRVAKQDLERAEGYVKRKLRQYEDAKALHWERSQPTQ